MSKYIDIDNSRFKFGYWKGESLFLVAEEDPDYFQYLLNKDDLKPPLEAAEREALEVTLDSLDD